MKEKEIASDVYKIALSGGPCGGKSKSLSKISAVLKDRGYNVCIIKETATELIDNGLIPGKILTVNDFQNLVLEKQLNSESLYEDAAKFLTKNTGKKTVILCDRGVGDQMAYISNKDMKSLLRARDKSLYEVVNSYSLVLHLVTAANGAEDFYEWNEKEGCENKARSEPPEKAIEKDNETLKAWVSAGCHKIKVIDNSTNLDLKIERVIAEIFSVIGDPLPSEIERKFLIKMPDPDMLKNLDCVSKTNIIQTYLSSEEFGVERRVRQRGTEKEGYLFTKTEKRITEDPEVRIELEKIINVNEYVHLLTQADNTYHQISKKRTCFIYNNHFFELDIYPFSDEYAVLEIELGKAGESFELPHYFEVIKEVTTDKNFKNSSLAKNLRFLV